MLRERPILLQVQVVLHGDNRGVMKRQALVLDEVSERLVGAGVPPSCPGIGVLLLLVSKVLARLHSSLIFRSQTLIKIHVAGETVTRRVLRLEGPAVQRLLAILAEAVEAQELGATSGVPLVARLLAVGVEVVLTVSRRDPLRLCLVLEATALEVARVRQHLHTVRRAPTLVRRSARGRRSGPCAGVLEFLSEGGGEVMQQLGIPSLLVVVLELIDVYFDTLILGRGHEIVVVAVVRA